MDHVNTFLFYYKTTTYTFLSMLFFRVGLLALLPVMQHKAAHMAEFVPVEGLAVSFSVRTASLAVVLPAEIISRLLILLSLSGSLLGDRGYSLCLPCRPGVRQVIHA
jgi:hypothetical protein